MEQQQFKKAGRKPKAPEDRVINKPVYLTAAEWKLVEDKYGAPTNAMRETALKQAQVGIIDAPVKSAPVAVAIQDLNQPSNGSTKNLNQKKKSNYTVNTKMLESRRNSKLGIRDKK